MERLMIGWLATIGILYWLLRAAAKAEKQHKHKYYTLKTAKYMAWSWIAGFIYLVLSFFIKLMIMIEM
jgi:hypothetical protein